MRLMRWGRNSERGSNLTEYALGAVLLVGVLTGMRTYVARGVQARYKTVVDGAITALKPTSTAQYEPYYTINASTVTQDEAETYTYKTGGTIVRDTTSTTTKDPGAAEQVLPSFEADDDWK